MHILYAALIRVANWLAGDGSYMTLAHCMGHDWFWINTTIFLDLANAAGYVVIAYHWWRNARTLPRVPAKSALSNIRDIFIFCGMCGYLFIPVKVFWPAWRLYDMFLAVLVVFTWRYALRTRELKVIYSAIGRSTKLETELEHSLEESRRKSAFLNAISHDLRTPLNGLVLQTNVAELSLDDPDQLKSALDQIRACAAASASMLDSLLEFARLDSSEQPNQMQTVKMRPLLSQCIAAHEVVASSKGLTLELSCPADLTIVTDRSKMERIVNNLLSNAVKFTHIGGVRIIVDHSQKGCEVHVVDTGIGISVDNQGKLFDEFFQIHNHERDRSKGFGLGLAISRRLARQLGGDINLESAPAVGSRFSLVLPNAACQSGRDPANAVVSVGN